MSEWSTYVIPYAVDTDLFQPLDKVFARRILGLSTDKEIILFGALGNSPIKGLDLLLQALPLVAQRIPDAIGVVFGQAEPPGSTDVGMPLRWIGRLHDDIALALVYSAADVMVVPSRQDNLPQTAMEAQACGTPVVAFNTSGLPDAVAHGESGLLVEPFSAQRLAEGIVSILEDQTRLMAMGATARERAVELWNPSEVARQYLGLYNDVLTKADLR